jgi:MFS family permease
VAGLAHVPSEPRSALSFFALTALALWYLAHYWRAPWLYPAFYVWVGIYGVLAPAQVWTLANEVLTTRQAKRLFGLVGSGAIAGFICGGYLTRELVGRFETEAVLLAMALLLALCIVVVVVLFRQRVAAAAEAAREADATRPAWPVPPSAPTTACRRLRLVRSSPYPAIAVICLSSSATTRTGSSALTAPASRWTERHRALLGDLLYAGIATCSSSCS